MKAARTNTERNFDPEGRKHNESVSTYGAPGTRPRTEIHAFADAKKESAAGSYAESAMTSEGFEVTDEDIPF